MSSPSIATHVLFSALCILLSACSERPVPDKTRDLTLLPLSPPPPPQTIPAVEVPSGGACIPLPRGPLRLTGTLSEEQRLGPPGYGESPDKDAHLTIYLLALRKPFEICTLDDRAQVSSVVHRINAVQLTGHIDPAQMKGGVGVSVFGTMEYQKASHDFTEVVVRVDSIPTLRPPRPVPST